MVPNGLGAEESERERERGGPGRTLRWRDEKCECRGGPGVFSFFPFFLLIVISRVP